MQQAFAQQSLFGKAGLAGSLAGSKSTGDTELSVKAVHTVRGVQVLLDHNLEARGAALPRGNDRPGEEELPDLQLTKVSDIHLAVVGDMWMLTLNQRWPYLALMVSELPSQLRYHLQRVAE